MKVLVFTSLVLQSMTTTMIVNLLLADAFRISFIIASYAYRSFSACALAEDNLRGIRFYDMRYRPFSSIMRVRLYESHQTLFQQSLPSLFALFSLLKWCLLMNGTAKSICREIYSFQFSNVQK